MLRPDLYRTRRYVRALSHLDRDGVGAGPWRRHLVETIQDQMRRMTPEQGLALVEYVQSLESGWRHRGRGRRGKTTTVA